MKRPFKKATPPPARNAHQSETLAELQDSESIRDLASEALAEALHFDRMADERLKAARVAHRKLTT